MAFFLKEKTTPKSTMFVYVIEGSASFGPLLLLVHLFVAVVILV